MERCLQAACSGAALATWWLLCDRHTLALDDVSSDVLPDAMADQASAAGWDAADWAERISPARWGHADEQDPWVRRQRALSFALTVSRRAVPCPHAAGYDAATPLVMVARAPEQAACPPCAEQVVARTTTSGHGCDRCLSVPVDADDRTALLVGRSLILVAQLCDGCAATTLVGFSLPLDGA